MHCNPIKQHRKYNANLRPKYVLSMQHRNRKACVQAVMNILYLFDNMPIHRRAVSITIFHTLLLFRFVEVIESSATQSQ